MANNICSYCMQPAEVVKKCGKCKKRNYCSAECQKTDWTDGQRHKNWCGLTGEEGEDFAIHHVEGKGLGVFALRDFRKLERIMVDRFYTEEEFLGSKDKKGMDLMPSRGTLKDKFDLNCIGFSNDKNERKNVIAIRMARVNHGCDFNSEHIYEPKFQSIILYATRDIKKGEEITFLYKHGKEGRMSLFFKWGILCEPECVCWGLDDIYAKIDETDKEIFKLGSQKEVEKALEKVDELIQLCERVGFVSCMSRCFYDGFQISIMKKKFLKLSREYLSRHIDIITKIMHPESPTFDMINKLYDMPQTNPNFLVCDVDGLSKLGLNLINEKELKKNM